jgi:hypothetical protein
MTSEEGRDWRAILLLVGGGGSGLLAVGGVLSLAAYAAFDAWRGRQSTSPATEMGIMVALGALVLIGAILIISGYQALLAVLGKPMRPTTSTRIGFSTGLILLLVWLAASMLAPAVIQAGGPIWLASPLHVLAIGAPVYLVARLSTGGLVGGTPLRMWGTLAAGLVGGTGISALVEIAFLLTGVLATAVFLLQNPESLLAAEGLLHELSLASGVENSLAVLQPILLHPMAVAAVLVAVSVVTPIVEELAKSAAPWFIYGRLRSAAEGFWCGAVSGAGFALFEGLMASADISGNWTVIFWIRAWSSMMHILASGLAGWGIAAFRVTGRSSRLVAGYAFAIGIHSLWNAAVVGIGYGGLRSTFGQDGPDAVAMAAILAGGLTLFALAVGIPAAILLINRTLRTPVAGLEGQLPSRAGLALTPPRLEG